MASRINPITVLGLYEMLAVRGSTFASLMVEVNPDKTMRKTGNPYFGKCFKRSNIVANIGINRVNKLTRIECRRAARVLPGTNWRELYAEREAAGNMVAVGPRQWGTKLPNLPIVHHKGNVYIQLSVEHASRPTYHWLNGTRLTAAQVAELKTFQRDTDREDYIHREYGIAGVRRINIGRKRYRVEHTEAMLEALGALAGASLLVAAN